MPNSVHGLGFGAAAARIDDTETARRSTSELMAPRKGGDICANIEVISCPTEKMPVNPNMRTRGDFG